jgi:hypothetical protein
MEFVILWGEEYTCEMDQVAEKLVVEKEGSLH